LPPQLTGPVGAGETPVRLLSLPQPVSKEHPTAVVDNAATSALPGPSSFTDLAFAMSSPATLSRQRSPSYRAT
jgi:hypothetical protein